MSNRNGYSVGNVAGTVHKPGDSDFNRTMREELFHNWQYRYDGGIGFGAAWLTGVANREFNIDGTIEYDKKGNLKGVQNGDILAFTSGTPSNSSNGFWDSVVDWTWSTLSGGYSHVTTVKKGRITQYGKSYEGKKYSGRNYKVIGNRGLRSLRATRIDPNKAGLNKQQRAKYYNSLTNNCTTSLAKGLKIPHQWAPYNIYSHFNNAQFAWGYY